MFRILPAGDFSKRLILSVVLLLMALVVGLQSFTPPASSQNTKDVQALDRVLRKHELIELDPIQIEREVGSGRRISIATSERTFNLELTPHDMRATGYQAAENGVDELGPRAGRRAVRTFKGRVTGLEEARARFTIDENTTEGVIITPGERYYVEPLKRYSTSAGKTDFVFYKGSDVIEETPYTCGVTMDERIDQAAGGVAAAAGANPGLEKDEGAELSDITVFKEVDVATEADYEFVTALGGASNANDEILSIMNQVEGIYEAEVGVQFRIVYQNAWTITDDPYTSTSPPTLVGEFRNYWTANRIEVQRDIAHMWTGKDLDGSTVGIAYLGVVCRTSSPSYGITQRLTSAPARYAIPAHEIGHNFNATHSNNQPTCDDTVMQSSGSPSTQLTFCPYSRGEITAHLNNYPGCLGAVTVVSQSPSLVWRNQANGAIGKWLMNGVSLAQSVFFNPGTVSDLNWRMAGSGDFNSDGKPDLVWQHMANGLIGIWFMDGTTLLQSVYFTPNQVADTNWKVVGVADFSGDGKPDLVWQNGADGSIGVWLMNGTTLVAAPFFSPGQVSDTNWKIVGVGDFNSDGNADPVWQNVVSRLIGVWLMSGTTSIATPLFSPAQVGDANWTIAAVADFNGDAKSDLVWQNSIDGNIGVWYMNGTSLIQSTYFSPSQVSDTNWKIVATQ